MSYSNEEVDALEDGEELELEEPTTDEVLEDEPMEWSREQELIAAGLAEGRTHEQAGALANRSAKTVQRYLKDDSFRRYVDDKRAARVEQVTDRLVGLADRGLRVLTEILDDLDAPTRSRIEVARYMVDASHKQHRDRTDRDLIRRVCDLEQAGDQMVRPAAPTDWDGEER